MIYFTHSYKEKNVPHNSSSIRYAILIFLCCFFANSTFAQNSWNIQLTQSDLDCTNEQVCYQVELQNSNGGSWALGDQNYRFFYDADLMAVTSISSLLPNSSYGAASLDQDDQISGLGQEAASPLDDIDDNLGFLDFSITQTDKSNPSAATQIGDDFIAVAKICIDVDAAAINNPNTCLSFYHSRPTTAGTITTQYTVISENDASESTTVTSGVGYNDLTSTDGAEACLALNCDSCALLGGDTDNDGICDDNDCEPNDSTLPVSVDTACDDGDPNTINDMILANSCTCAGTFDSCATQGGDTDGDGICDDNDCEPNDSTLPVSVDTACDDGDPNTINDMILANSCTCAGTPMMALNDWDIQLTLGSLNCTTNEACYQVEVQSASGTNWALGDQNYRIFFDGDLTTVTSVTSLLPNTFYSNVTINENMKYNGQAVENASPLDDIDNNLGFLDFNIIQIDKSNPANATQAVPGTFTAVAEICVAVDPSVTTDLTGGTCLAFYHSRLATAGTFTAQYTTISENNAAGSTTPAMAASYNDLTSADGTDACLGPNCDPCVDLGGDTDGDGICDDNDCEPNDSTLPVLVDTACDDGDSNTINDMILANSCTCAGTDPCEGQGGDTDGDGICDDNDCAPNDSTLPVSVDTACDDGDSNTINDMILANSCTCAGTDPCEGQGGDTDGDGICDDNDCAPNDSTLPVSVDTACDDGDSNTINDMILANSCTCAGTDPCEGQGGDTDGDGICDDNDCAPNDSTLPVSVDTACDDGDSNTINDMILANSCTCAGTDPCEGQGGDTDGDGICDDNDCAPNDSTLPVSVDTACDDGDSNTINDMILANSCTCAGTDPCEGQGGDTDGDGICDDNDCAPNDSTLPVSVDTACDDGDSNTINDMILANSCTCAGTDPCEGQGGDTDGDGICDDNDCAPLNPDLPTTPGTACGDGNPNTVNDVILADGCTCQGTFDPCATQGGDTDGDGICDDNDCEPNDDTLPTTPGTACDDGNSNTVNDIIKADGCTCQGTPETIDCNNISITTGNNSIKVSGLDGAPVSSVEIYNNPGWELQFSCFANCDAMETISVTPGSYFVKVKFYTAGYQFVCQEALTVVVTDGGGGCDNVTDGGTIGIGNSCDNSFQICGASGTAPTIGNCISATGGSGNLQYVWLKNEINCFAPTVTFEEILANPNISNWKIIPGETGTSLNPGIISTNTCYTRCARRNSCDDYNGESNIVSITVNPNCGGCTDNDDDGVCADEDCDDNNPNLPATVGSTCNDNDSNTVNDVYLADGCTCKGTPVSTCDNVNFGGKIGFGTVCTGSFEVCDGEDAPVINSCSAPSGGSGQLEIIWLKNEVSCNIPNVTVAEIIANPSISDWTIISGATNTSFDPGTLSTSTCYLRCARRAGCDQYLGESNIVQITVDPNCGGGGDPDCDDLSIETGDGTVTISGLDGAPVSSVHVFRDPDWNVEFTCFGNCNATETVNVPAGTYYVYARYYTAGYVLICEKIQTVTVTTGGGCTDNDNDGVCADEDCDDNNPNLPATVGSTCNDNDSNTINDVYLADGCTCKGTPVSTCDNQGGDADNDGVCADEDCDDNNPNLPATVGSTCNDNDSNTVNDVYLADGCTCKGTPVSTCDNVNFGGEIGFGTTCTGSFEICDGEDAPVINSCSTPSGGSGQLEIIWLKNEVSCSLPNVTVAEIIANPSISDWTIISGATNTSFDPGTLSTSTCYLRCARRTGCDQYLGESNIVQITVDQNCGGGGDPDCDDLSIETGDGTVTISGLDGAPVSSVHVFSNNYQQQEFTCFANCGATETVNVSAGTYHVYARYYTAAYILICEKIQTVTVTTGGGCTDNDNDGVCADEDCDDNNPNIPTTPGTACDDGNPNTTNEVYLADGCTCGGGDNPCANQGGDADNDGVCADEDCDDNNPNLPATVGSTCNDNDSNTINDVYLADGCTCEGTPVSTCDNVNFGGKIGFGAVCTGSFEICDGEDAPVINSCSTPSGGSGQLEIIWLKNEVSCSLPNVTIAEIIANPSISDWTIMPSATNTSFDPGTLSTNTCYLRCARRAGCDQYLGESNIVQITVDPNCGGGGGPDCDDLSIETGDETIVVSGLDGAPVSSVHVFSNNYQQQEFTCFANCGATETVNVSAGTYHVYARYYTAAYILICEKIQTVTVTSGGGGGDPCNNFTDGGEIGFFSHCASSIVYCPGNGGLEKILTCDFPSGGSGAIEYLWLKSTISSAQPTSIADPNWSIIAGANQSEYQPSGVNETTFFARCARRAGCLNYIGESNVVAISVDPNCNGGGGTTDPNCGDVTISANNGNIIATGLDGAPITSVQVFAVLATTWENYFSCFENCDSPTQTIPVIDGTYHVYVKYYTASYNLICTVDQGLNVVNGQALVANISSNNDLDFQVNQWEEHAELMWAHNKGNFVESYVIERSADGETFEEISANASKGTESIEFYQDFDVAPMNGDNYYRVRMDNRNGSVSYSAVQMIHYKDVIDFSLFPNPANNYVKVNLESVIGNEVDIHFYNNLGQRVKAIHLDEVYNKYYQIDINDLKEGYYNVWMQIPGKRPITKPLVVGHI